MTFLHPLPHLHPRRRPVRLALFEAVLPEPVRRRVALVLVRLAPFTWALAMAGIVVWSDGQPAPWGPVSIMCGAIAAVALLVCAAAPRALTAKVVGVSFGVGAVSSRTTWLLFGDAQYGWREVVYRVGLLAALGMALLLWAWASDYLLLSSDTRARARRGG